MRKTLFLMLLALVLPFALFAQKAEVEYITVRGKITTQGTKEAVPYAMVYTTDRSAYTTANADGEYVLKLPKSQCDGSLVFAQTGYHRDTLAVAKLLKKGNVALVQGDIKLNEVQVTAYKTPKALMKEVISRIPQNYTTDTTIVTGFFRTVRTANDELYLFAEYVADIMRPGYGKNPKRKVGIHLTNLSSVQKMRLMYYDTLLLGRMAHSEVSTTLMAGYDNEEFTDRVEMFKTYLKVTNSDTLSEFTDADGRSYYLISSGRSKYTIDQQSLAITRIEFSSPLSPTISLPLWILPGGKEVTPLRKFQTSMKAIYNYDRVGDRYTLVSFVEEETRVYHNETSGRWEGVMPTITTKSHRIFQLTGLQHSTATFSPTITNRYYAVTYSEVPVATTDYNEDYWEQFNFIPVEQSLLDKLNAKLKNKR
ncbi:MAG: carboxypeptidase-like regulatory domain-containing protein [Bacteroidales bacterium]|nr:carboxypeptidase-like regulatory domain-containing protein [Bacteroidales bacterium]